MKRSLSQDQDIVSVAANVAPITCEAVASSNESSSSTPLPPYTLNSDCWKHIFNYLRMEDVHSMAQTCKHIHQIAGDYFGECTPALNYELRENCIRCSYPYWFSLEPISYKFVSRLELIAHNQLSYTLDAQTFPSLKTVIFKYATLNARTIQNHRMLLTNIESLHITRDWINNRIFEAISVYCPKLKCLDVQCPHSKNDDIEQNLFLQHYPYLEDFRYEPCFTMRINHLELFLTKHPNLKQFTTNFRFFWLHRDIFSEMPIQLEMLTIVEKVVTTIPFDAFVELLRRLYERGFYKSLHLSLDHWKHEYHQLIKTIPLIRSYPQFKKMNTLDVYDFSRLTNLTELHFAQLDSSMEGVENLAKNLKNLEVLIINDPKLEHILPFLRHSTKLKKYITKCLISTEHDDFALDLVRFNQERVSLANARKVIIYVQDSVYIPTKWKYDDLNFSHVKVIRSHLYEYYSVRKWPLQYKFSK